MPASLTGLFTAATVGAEGTGATITTGSRTTAGSSLITVSHGGFAVTNAGTLAESDSKSNSFTQAVFNALSGDNTVKAAMSYNLPTGTRGASHTVSGTQSGSSGGGPGHTVGGAEWAGVASAATVTTGTVATGTSTAPSCQVTVPSGTALVVAVMAYGGSSTTIANNVGTQVQELDENSDFQAHATAYLAGQTGTVTISWTLGASRAWVCRAVAFEEFVAPTVDQEGFRFRNDDGSETTATWMAAQDTNITAPVDTNVRLRDLANITGDLGATQLQLEYQLVRGGITGAYRKVPPS